MNEEQLKKDKLKLEYWSIMIPEQEEEVVLVSHVKTLLAAQSRIERARAIELVELQFKNIFTNWSAKNKKRACKDGLEIIKQEILSHN